MSARPIQKNIIIIEGIPGSGKTTLVEEMRGLYEITCVDQIADHISSASDPDDYYLASEIIKYGICNNATNEVVLCDRNFVSLLAYTHAYDETFRTTRHKKIREVISDFLKNGTLVEPDLYIYMQLDVVYSYIRKRRVQSKVFPSPWSNPIFLRSMAEYYNDYFRKRNNVIPVSVDGERFNSVELKRLVESVFNVVIHTKRLRDHGEVQQLPVLRANMDQLLNHKGVNNGAQRQMAHNILVIAYELMHRFRHSLRTDQKAFPGIICDQLFGRLGLWRNDKLQNENRIVEDAIEIERINLRSFIQNYAYESLPEIPQQMKKKIDTLHFEPSRRIFMRRVLAVEILINHLYEQSDNNDCKMY